MGLRYRRSMKLAPGVRMNFSGGGIGWSLGPRGASVGIGRRGAFLNAGVPGTGLSYREKIGAPGRSPSWNMSVSIKVEDDGTLTFEDQEGRPLSESLVTRVKRQHGEVVRDLIQRKCDEINSQIEALGEIHVHMPSPHGKPAYVPLNFQALRPDEPAPRRIRFFDRMFKKRRERIERENEKVVREYEAMISSWESEKLRFEQSEAERRQLIERRIYDDVYAMESFLEANLQEIVWPRETIVSAEVLEGGNRVYIDVDVPELEHMPTNTASVPQRGYKLTVKELTPAKVQRLYVRHVHGIGLRIIGETFAALPKAQQVVLSAYSQRPDPATGHDRDEYLYSVRVNREQWSGLNFDSLQDVDVVQALSPFDLRREMSKTGTFAAIDPFGPGD